MNPDFTQYLDQASKIHTVFAVPLWAGVIKKQLEKLCGFEICLTSHLLSYIVFLVSVAATHTGCACPLWRGTHCTAANDPEKWFYQHFFHFCMILSVFLFIYYRINDFVSENVVIMLFIWKIFRAFLNWSFELSPARLSHHNTETQDRDTHQPPPSMAIMLQNNHQFSAQSMLRFPKTDSKQCKHKRRWPPTAWFLKCYCQAALHWAPSLSLILTDRC